MIEGTYEGRTYSIEPFPTDDGKRAWFVQRDGGERHEVRVSPASCTCGWWIWKLKGLSWRKCVHIRAVQHLLKGTLNEQRHSDGAD